MEDKKSSSTQKTPLYKGVPKEKWKMEVKIPRTLESPRDAVVIINNDALQQ